MFQGSGLVLGRSERLGIMLISIFCALGTTQPWGNLYDEESNKYLSKSVGQRVQLQLVCGGGEQERGGGSHNVCCIPKNNLAQLSHVSRQEGIKSGLFSPSLCSPLMPPNQPGGDIIILKPGVTVGKTPGAGGPLHFVFTCVCTHVRVHVCVYVYAWQSVSLWPHHRCVSQIQPVQTCTLSSQPQCTFSVFKHTCTRWARYPVVWGKHHSWQTSILSWPHTSGF